MSSRRTGTHGLRRASVSSTVRCQEGEAGVWREACWCQMDVVVFVGQGSQELEVCRAEESSGGAG